MKKSFALRVDADVYNALEKWATDEFRSINGQIEYLLTDALRKAKRYPRRASVQEDRNGEKQKTAMP